MSLELFENEPSKKWSSEIHSSATVTPSSFTLMVVFSYEDESLPLLSCVKAFNFDFFHYYGSQDTLLT